MTIADLTKPMAEALRDEIDRLTSRSRGHFPRNRAEANRRMIKAIQRFMDDQRAHVRQAANLLMNQEEAAYRASIAPQLSATRDARRALDERFHAESLAIEDEFENSIAQEKNAHAERMRSIREDLASRMSEADAIMKSTIKAIKEADWKELMQEKPKHEG